MLAIGGAGVAAVVTLCVLFGMVALRGRPPQPVRLPSGSTDRAAEDAARHAAEPVSDSRGEAAADGSSKPTAVAIAEAETARFSRTLPPPHLPEELRSGLKLLEDRLKTLGAGDSVAEREAALVRLRMYRFLCGLSYTDLVLDERLNKDAIAAAAICCQLGKLTHTPENPGLDADTYAQACRGAGSGNLASGIASLVRAVDGWMDDSDAANIDVLGHRRWCLNPPLRRVGFGRKEGWCAMWAHDRSGDEPCALAAVAYPPPGLVPIDMFRPNYAWSVSLNPRFFRRPGPGEIHVEVRNSKGVVLNLEKDVLETNGYGIDNCIIFRPRDLATTVGARYSVSIEDVHDHNERSGILSYEVEFIVR